MPFCTQCGHQNPEGSRFCSQCGTRLEPAAAAAPATGGPGESASESTATITFGGPTPEAEHREERSLNDSDAAAVDALPAGSALLVVQRGPSAGSRFLLDTDVVTAGRHPDSDIFLDDVTVSRRHAEFRRTADGFTVSRRRQPQRHLRQPRPDRRGRAAGRRRGPDRQVPPGLLRQPRPDRAAEPCRQSAASAPGAAEHRGGPRAAARGLPGRHISKIRFLEAEGLSSPSARLGYRKFSHRRRGAAALRAALPARPLPAAEGDQGAPRRHRPRPRAAGPRRAGEPQVPQVGARRRRLPGPESFAPTPPSCGCRRSELLKLAEIDDSLLDAARAASAWCAAAAGTAPLRRRRAGDRQDGGRAGRVRARAAAPARVQDRRRPGGRPDRAGRRARCAGGRDAGGLGAGRGDDRRARRAVRAAARRTGQGRRCASATLTAAGPRPLLGPGVG